MARRPSIIPGILSVFTSERHLKVLLEKENAVLIGTAIDELIRHHPSLKAAVFDALKSTIIKIEELGNVFEIPQELRQWYRLVPVPPSPVAQDGDVAMEDLEAAHVVSVSAGVGISADEATDALDDEDDIPEPKAHDNYIVSFIDILGRVSSLCLPPTPGY